MTATPVTPTAPHPLTNKPNHLPPRSLEQRRQALRHANVVRSDRARLKVDLKAGRITFLDLVVDPPEFLLTAQVYEILVCVPKIGRVKAQKALNRHKISPTKTFAGLTRRQRDELHDDIGLSRLAGVAWSRS